MSEKRNRQFKDVRNKVARFLVNWCLNNNVGTIIHGWNQGIKNNSKMSKKVNQEFVTIPNAAIKNRIEQLATQYGITFIEQEESYSSKSNFFGNDELPTFGEKSERKPIFTGNGIQAVLTPGELKKTDKIHKFLCDLYWPNQMI